ncbi:MAG TPA: hypothetical protein VGL27_08940 [Negativicutes bacterium]|jgi:hypothetical protein
MVLLLVFVGLLVVILGMLVTSLRKSPANAPPQAYVLRGLALVIFAIGAFSVGKWIIEVLFTGMLDTNYATLGEWMIAVPMILVFLFLSDRRKPIQTPGIAGD